MKCDYCGEWEMLPHTDVYRMNAGLDNDVVVVGIDVSQCAKCGTEAVAIPRMNELFQVLAEMVATKQQCLTPKEITFLRKHLGMGNDEFSRIMDVAVEHARRWQRGDSPMPVGYERLLRVLVLGQANRDELSDMATQKALPSRTRARQVDNHWRMESMPMAAGF